MIRTTVTREKSKLEKETWEFVLLDDGKIQLSAYQRWTRASARHKWREKRGTDYRVQHVGGGCMTDTQVPWDDTIVMEAKLGITSRLWVGRWSDIVPPMPVPDGWTYLGKKRAKADK